ncbi:MAG: hypothetical protein IBX72_03465 [Nitrospirae bacterium]|nr:hypothetical protein [Nitrospirota bacterium]
MKKRLISGLIVALSLVLTAGFAFAAVTGQCSNCHTMHYSQNGEVPAGAEPDGPWPVLLLGSCMGCHSNTGTATIKTGGIPVVWNTGGGTTDPGTAQSWSGANYNLAGGNFFYVSIADSRGHNIDGMYNQDAFLENNPPGYETARDPSTVRWSDSYMLTCAGSNGCHGNRNVDRSTYTDGFSASFVAIKGAHHGDDSTIDGSTVAASFRFLGSSALSTYSVLGLEDDDWQQSAAVDDHNEYKGAITQTDTKTISYLCSQCHGYFHSEISDQTPPSSPWTRHPTDTDVMGKGGEYANYNDVVAAGTYSLEAPVGYVNIPASPRQIVTAGDSPVICLSCHRAHGSPHDDILRWDYSTMLAGGGGADGTGCFRCHTTKD